MAVEIVIANVATEVQTPTQETMKLLQVDTCEGAFFPTLNKLQVDFSGENGFQQFADKENYPKQFSGASEVPVLRVDVIRIRTDGKDDEQVVRFLEPIDPFTQRGSLIELAVRVLQNKSCIFISEDYRPLLPPEEK